MSNSESEKKSWIRKIAEASKKLDKYQIIAGAALIAYGLIAVASSPFWWGVGITGSSVAITWAAEKVIVWDERKQKKKIIYKRINDNA